MVDRCIYLLFSLLCKRRVRRIRLDMKLKIDKPTVHHLVAIISYGLNIQSDNPLVKLFIQAALESLKRKLHRGEQRISKAFQLQVTPAEVLAFETTANIYNRHFPNSPHYLISLEYFIQPLQKQLHENIQTSN